MILSHTWPISGGAQPQWPEPCWTAGDQEQTPGAGGEEGTDSEVQENPCEILAKKLLKAAKGS